MVQPSNQCPMLLVSLASSRSPKLSVSIVTDQLARSGLTFSENDSLGERELDNETNNFGR